MAVKSSSQAVKEWAESRLRPIRLKPAELRSLHIAGDHTLDPDPEEQLNLEVKG